MINFSELKDQIIAKIEKSDDALTFIASNGKYMMYHERDCCENVYIEDICGDLNDILYSPILIAEEVTSKDEEPPEAGYDTSYTWTFYKLATIKGSVTIRWFGTSNGYYSESVDFIKIESYSRHQFFDLLHKEKNKT